MTATLDSSTVAQYLSEHPNFFEEHTALLGEVKLSSPLTGRTISLQERQMEVMRDKYKALELRMSKLSRLAGKMATSPASFTAGTRPCCRCAAMPTCRACSSMRCKAVSTCPTSACACGAVLPEHASGWFTEDVTADVRMFANSLQAPYCGSNRDFEAVHWLQADKIESTVMIALRAPAPRAPSACWCSVRPTANGSPPAWAPTSSCTSAPRPAPPWRTCAPARLPEHAMQRRAARATGWMPTAQLAQRKLSPHTLDAYGRDLRALLALSGDAPDGPRPQRRAPLRAKLHAGGLDPRSIARKLSSWRGFFNWLSGETALGANPVDGIRAPKRPDPAESPVGGRCRAPRRTRAAPAGWRRAGTAVQPRHVRAAVFERLARLRADQPGHPLLQGRQRPACLAGLARQASFEVIVTGKGSKMRRCLSARPPSWP
jgi:hypothetical protein